MMHQLKISTKTPIVLVDCSYYIFYRYYATYNSFKFRNNRHPVLSIKSDDEHDQVSIGGEGNGESECEDDTRVFLESFEKHFQDDLKKIKKRFSSNIVMCVDCLREDIWRKKLFPEYKEGRKHKENFHRGIFDQFKNKINNKVIQISHPSLESDDIIAILHKRIKEMNVDAPIVIITNDNDYLQLSDKHTRIVNMLKGFPDIRARYKHPIDTQLTRKILEGDKSDNIPKLGIRLTKELVDRIVDMTEDERVAFMTEHNILDQYKFNTKLISFAEIPDEFVKDLSYSVKIEKMI